MSTFFGEDYDEKLDEQWKAIIAEIDMYFKDGEVGGWSSGYCMKTWKDETLQNEADLEIFDLLLKIDVQNGADTSKIVRSLCYNGAFAAVKVRFRQNFY